MEPIKQFKHNNRTIKIFFDPEPFSPRKEWDNGTKMVHWHSRWDIGDEKIERISGEELKETYEKMGDPILCILPLYLYDHSGLSVSTGAYSCDWDSGQVGWVFITKSLSEKMGWKDLADLYLENIIRSDVNVYDKYLRGEVYGYIVYGQEGDELESCWGYFTGEDCIYDAKCVAEHAEDPAVEKMVLELESRATYAAGLEQS